MAEGREYGKCAPKTISGPHAANSSATCWVPNSVGAFLWAMASTSVDREERSCTAQNNLHFDTKNKASINCVIYEVLSDLHLEDDQSPERIRQVWREPAFCIRRHFCKS
jgi:hypothetical protein